MPAKQQVLFLCTGNACRSQMAEGWARQLLGDRIEVTSAGLEAQGLDPRAVQVMAEAGADIAGQSSKTLESLPLEAFDLVITVCDHAHRHCPTLGSRTRVLHQPFADPPRLAEAAASEEEALEAFRTVRDQIRDWVAQLPRLLAETGPG